MFAQHPTQFDRRQVLAGVSALPAGALASCALPGYSSTRTRLALADITVMRELDRDYAGTLRQVAALGYNVFGFRLTGYGGPTPGEPRPEDKARMVRAAGMEVGVVRLSVRNVDYDRELRQAADLGARIIAMTTAPVFIATREIGKTTRVAFDAWLPELASIGAKARALGLTLAYHTHPHDFVPLGGEAPLDIMAQQIPPETLSFELDLAWAWYAGVAPLDLLTRLGPRVASMHWKDIDRARGTSANEHAVAPGSGEMGYESLLPRIRQLSSATGYVEVDKPDDGLAAAASAAQFIQRVLGDNNLR